MLVNRVRQEKRGVAINQIGVEAAGIGGGMMGPVRPFPIEMGVCTCIPEGFTPSA